MWEWKNEKGDYITSQLRYLGASADWTRGRFTMDEDMSASVAEARPPPRQPDSRREMDAFVHSICKSASTSVWLRLWV